MYDCDMWKIGERNRLALGTAAGPVSWPPSCGLRRCRRFERSYNMATTIIVNYFGVSREVWNALSQLIARMRVPVPNLPSLPKQYTINRLTVLAVDTMCAQVAARDGKSPSVIFDSNWNFARDHVHQLVLLESRIGALGY
jgi:hypothetical protein